jgi:hypothetical protein
MSLQIGYIDNGGHPKIMLKVQGTNVFVLGAGRYGRAQFP